MDGQTDKRKSKCPPPIRVGTLIVNEKEVNLLSSIKLFSLYIIIFINNIINMVYYLIQQFVSVTRETIKEHSMT